LYFEERALLQSLIYDRLQGNPDSRTRASREMIALQLSDLEYSASSSLLHEQQEVVRLDEILPRF